MHPRLYTDDTQLSPFFTSTTMDAVQTLEGCLTLILKWTNANRLKLNPDKMEIHFLGGPLDKLGDCFPSWMVELSLTGIRYMT